MTEIALKEWLYNESLHYGVKSGTILTWKQRGYYPGIRLRYEGRRALVQLPSPTRVFQSPPPGCTCLTTWLAQEALKDAVSPHGVYMRLLRGKYPTVERVKAGRGRAEFVKLS